MVALFTYYGAYGVFPFLALAAYLIARGEGFWRWVMLIALIPAVTVAWARFAEPAWLRTERAEIVLAGATADGPSLRIALFADTHVGKFGNAPSLARIVDQVNQQDVDLVLIAGDLVFRPRSGQIESEIGALARLEAPAIAILGNHDVGAPGPDNRRAVRTALEGAGVSVLEDTFEIVEVSGQQLAISGLRDLWDRLPIDTDFASNIPEGLPHITLAHNPDTALYLPTGFDYDLMLSGHTHGGQIRLPFLFHLAIPCEGDWDRDLHSWRDSAGAERLVWVTPGTGMVDLPFRLFQPPRIDILTLHLPEPDPAP